MTAIFLVLGLAIPAGAADTKTVQDNAGLIQQVNQIAKQNGVAAYTVVAFEGEDILFSHSGGDAREGVPATSATIYRAASISKMVSGMLVMTLCEQGKLTLNDDISRMIDRRLQNPAFPNNPPTVGHLLTHTSSIVDGKVYTEAIDETPFPPLDFLLDEGIAFGGQPGSSFSYSDFGMGLAAAVVENASGQYFSNYARDTLFQPMGIDSGYMIDYLADQSTLAAMGEVDPLSWISMRRAYGSIPFGQMYLLAQGELYISAEDLAKVSMILAGDGSYNGKRYLQPETVNSINKVYARYYDTTMGYGLAVQATDELIPGVTLFGHQGNAYGSISCVFYEPGAKRGVVFLTSGASGVKLQSGVYKVNQDVVKTVWNIF